MRLREAGLTVFGFGERKTPDAFRKACHRFVYTDLLEPVSEEQPKQQKSSQAPAAKKPKVPKSFLLAALDETSDDSGWANLGAFGSYLNNVQPDFDPRTYGFRKLSDLIRSRTDLFVIEERASERSSQPILFVRAK